MKQLDDKELFGSKFQDFGAAPSDAVWKGIEAAMPQEKKKKRGAFWWWTSGLAASLLLYFGMYSGVQSMNASNTVSRSASTVKPSSSDKNQMTNFHSDQHHSTNGFTNTNPNLNNNNFIQTTKIGFFIPFDSSTSTSPKTMESFALKAKKGLKFTVPSIQHFQPTAQNDSNSLAIQPPTQTSNNSKKWRLGLVVEQTRRSELNKSYSAPSPTGPLNLAPVYTYDWYRSRSILMEAQVDLSKRLTFGTGVEYSTWDNFKQVGGSLKASSGKSVGIPLQLTYFIAPQSRFRVGFQLDVRNRLFVQQSDTLYPQPISAGVNYDLESSYGTNGTQQIRAFQQQYGLGLVAHWNITPYLGWTTVFEMQSSGWRSQIIQPRLGGNWFGIKSGIYYQF